MGSKKRKQSGKAKAARHRRQTERDARRVFLRSPVVARVKAAKAALKSPGFSDAFAAALAFAAPPRSLEDTRAVVLSALRSLGVDVAGLLITLAWRPPSPVQPKGELQIWCRPAISDADVERVIERKAA